METVKVITGRRVALPLKCCNDLDIKEGDLFLVEWDIPTQKVTLTPAVIKPRSEVS